MTTIVTRAAKGSELTWDEMDANFTNLNTAKYEFNDSSQFTLVTINPSTSNKGVNFYHTPESPPTFRKAYVLDSYSALDGWFVNYSTIGGTPQSAQTFIDVAKVGRLVCVNMKAQFDAPPTGTGQVHIPLPYTSISPSFDVYIPLTIVDGNFDPITAEVVGLLDSGEDSLSVWYRANQMDPFSALTNSELSSSDISVIYGSFSYKSED